MKNNTVGARLDKILLDKIKEDGRSNTTIIREALAEYYFGEEKKNDVNNTLTAVNSKKEKDTYKTIREAIDKL